MKKTVYLARFGKVHGPFSDQELDAFQASGKIQEFAWMWDHASHAWRPLDPPPAPLFDAQDAPAAHANGAQSAPAYTGVPSQPYAQPYAQPYSQPQTREPQRPSGPSPMDLGFPATRGQVPVVCHNFRQVVSGFVQRMTATGCELNTSDGHLSPTFVNRAAVILNLLDGDSGKLMNVAARVCNVERTKTGWTYQVRWEERPVVLAA